MFFPPSSLVQALIRVGMQGQRREFQYTQSFTRSSPSNDYSANHVTHHRFDMPKGGASSNEAGLCLKGHRHWEITRILEGILNHPSDSKLLNLCTKITTRKSFAAKYVSTHKEICSVNRSFQDTETTATHR